MSNAQVRSVIAELKGRFAHFLETGDDSKIPTDLTRITYRVVRMLWILITNLLLTDAHPASAFRPCKKAGNASGIASRSSL